MQSALPEQAFCPSGNVITQAGIWRRQTGCQLPPKALQEASSAGRPVGVDVSAAVTEAMVEPGAPLAVPASGLTGGLGAQAAASERRIKIKTVARTGLPSSQAPGRRPRAAVLRVMYSPAHDHLAMPDCGSSLDPVRHIYHRQRAHRRHDLRQPA